MLSRPGFQLTRHPVGSMKEIWAVSWPLMLSLSSGSLMMFVDRLYLAHLSVEAMNAMAIAGLACFSFLVLPFGLSNITEVFVGRFHGEESHGKVGKPAWQIVWLSLALWPLSCLLVRLIASLIFAQDSLEAAYFVSLLDFCPFFLITVGLMGFFIGIGNARVITLVTIIGNLVNICIAPLFIFQYQMGIQGAAIAAGISQISQCALLVMLYVQKRYRQKFQTHHYSFDRSLTKEMLQVAIPSGLGRLVEVLALSVFFRIVAACGKEALTCATMVQSFFLLTLFCIDGLAKGTTSVISNLVGAKMHQLIPKALQAAMKVHLILFAFITLFTLTLCETIFSYILHGDDVSLLHNGAFLSNLHIALIWLCLFFLMDGFAWIHSGHLMSLSDSRYIMFAASLTHWFTYVIPYYFLMKYFGVGAAFGWALLALDATIMFTLFRHRSSRHINKFLIIEA